MITKKDLSWWLDLEAERDWQFATTYAESAPHEYVVAGKTPGIGEEECRRAAHVIRTYGEPMKFYRDTRVYLVTPTGWKHWDMCGERLDGNVGLINRGRIEHVYGTQNMPRTASNVESAYDAVATTWDAEHSMTEDERAATAALARATFGEKLWRTLDVGCGTGLLLDLGLTPATRYVGIDPSTAMLNALVMKYPTPAGVHPKTYADAERERVLCGTRFDSVLALGGSASYLTPQELERLRTRANRGVLLMHYAPDEAPITADLDERRAAESLAAASNSATVQMRIGRFVTTVVPGVA